eukprot:GFYU01013511.1.p1 GENE.GFYU01013511.1~~GFYU01013511.1.p1  ORF type:complete len:257 (-),score=53.98 GFYU01013511.1:245-1015(-)
MSANQPSKFGNTFDEGGGDSNGACYQSINEMWDAEVVTKPEDPESEKGWYGKGYKYWETIDATVDGVLGGYGYISDTDIDGSLTFLREMQQEIGVKFGVAVDCGAGIGRITKNLFIPFFDVVDMVEPDGHFLAQAKADMDSPKLRTQFQMGLQKFTPEPNSYDVIWIQWVIGHLTDADLVSFLQRCKGGLKPNGIICIKENNAKDGFLVDKDDSSVTRSNEHLKHLYEVAGCRLIKEKLQKKFPKELFRVRMYALQ